MKIFVIGWFGAGNMGDEAILMSELYWLREHIKGVEYYILAFDPDRIRELTANIPEVKKILRMGAKKNILYSNVAGILRTFREVDVVIIGGGGLFQDVYNYYPVPFFATMALLARLYRKRLIFYCLGIGPLNTFIGKKLCRFAVNLADMISVRDPESKELLKNLGVTKEICPAADPVFWLKPVWNEKVERLINAYHLGEQSPMIIVCVHNLLPWKNDTKKIVAESLDTLARERDAQIVFLPLGMYKNRWVQAESSDTVDIATSKELAALMSEKSFVITDELSPQECLAVIQRAALVMSMRFHGVVMGMNMGVPVMVLTFRQEIKLRNLMRRVGQEESCFDVGELEKEKFLKRIEQVLSKTDEIKQQLTEAVVFLQAKLEQCHELLFDALMETSR